jgi:MFS family permease
MSGATDPRQAMLTKASLPLSGTSTATRAFVIAWLCSLAFYFLEYAVRSSPAVMMPELSKGFGVSVLDVSQILGTYYYTYSTTSLICGLLLDRFGAKFVVPAGMAILGVGCMVFAVPNPVAGDVGRLLQGAGSAFAFTGAVYLASRGLSAARLATAIGVTQCLGMLGGTIGQVGSAPLIHAGIGMPAFWTAIGFVILVVGGVLLSATPRETIATNGFNRNVLSPYRIVLSNPQSYLCGIVAGLLFVPTTIGDMVWGVRFFQEDRLFSYSNAVFAVSMVPLGWVFGCPLMGWIADKMGRRKPALIGGAAMMLAAAVQLVYFPSLLPVWATLLIFGVASGAAMVPYTIIKEVNPDEVKGSATGAINFLTFGVTALIGPMFGHLYGQTMGSQGVDPIEHFKAAMQFWIAGIVLALIVSTFLRETGRARSR